MGVPGLFTFLDAHVDKLTTTTILDKIDWLYIDLNQVIHQATQKFIQSVNPEQMFNGIIPIAELIVETVRKVQKETNASNKTIFVRNV